MTRFTLLATLAAAVCGVLVLASCGDDAGDPEDNATASVTADSTSPTYAVTLSDAGCNPDSFTLHPGVVVFKVTNSGSTSVKEMEIQDGQGHVRGDVEGVEPGTTRSFVVDLKTGTYRVRCPQTATHGGTITVS